MTLIRAIRADITTLNVDAIVSSANTVVVGGGSVDEAIHSAAGPELKEECDKMGHGAVGDVKLTKGYRLPSKYVIHAYGPFWEGGDKGEKELLASCYRKSVRLAAQNKLDTIAFPCISTGLFGFPPDLASTIAIAAVNTTLIDFPQIKEVIFCCYLKNDLELYHPILLATGIGGNQN